MHELPATQGMLEVALEAAEKANAARILEIHLVVGELTSIVDDSVQFYFDLIARGTRAEGATLLFHREAARLDCGACGHTDDVVAPLPRSCPSCGSLRLRVTGGDAFRVESLEVDDTAASSPHASTAP
jgi:hydrogenase nickel incorporation protein HypA/HybF